VQALKRSAALVRGSWWRVLGIIVVGVLLVSVVAGVLQGILTLIPAALADGNDAVLALATVVSGTVAGTLTTPFTAAVFSLVYFDQRVRREGFDLELLAQGLGERAPDPSASPAALDYRPPEVTPEQRAQAPFWPPPPGWQPPPADPPQEPAPEPPPPPGGWQPPTPRRWPPESPERGPGGL
jgi:hypothetical protein